MAARPSLALVVLALSSLGAAYRTPNFVVEAPTPQIAHQVALWAEYYRKQKAQEWLGREMPPWGQPCPLKVKLSMHSGGATSFAFDQGSILSQQMEIEGPLDRLIKSVLPHEITHTVLAHYFRQPVPRWADEGGSVLSEDDVERNRHDRLVRQILNSGRAMPLRRLFALKEYPPDVMVLYAQGYSVSNFLVGRSSRGAFLAFIAQGMRGNWDAAARQHYGYRSVEELERAWLQHLRDGGRPPAAVASAGGRPGPAPGVPAGRVVVRQTFPPAQPQLGAPQPVARGVAPSEGDEAPPARPAPVLPRPSAPSAAPASQPFPPTSGFAAPSPAPPSGLMPPPPPPARLLAPQAIPGP
jgi:hypothetical protein